MVYYIYILLDECSVFDKVHLLPFFPSVSSQCLFYADSSLGVIPQHGSEADSIFVHKILKVSQVRICKVCTSNFCTSTSLCPRTWLNCIPSLYAIGFNKSINNLLILLRSLAEWTLKVHLSCLFLWVTKYRNEHLCHQPIACLDEEPSGFVYFPRCFLGMRKHCHNTESQTLFLAIEEGAFWVAFDWRPVLRAEQ